MAPQGYHTPEDLASLEQQVARRVDIGSTWIGMIASMVVFVLSLFLPFTGKASGIDVGLSSDTAHEFGSTPLETVYVWVALVTIVILGIAVLATRHIAVTYVDWVCGGVTLTLAVLTIWMGQTRLGAVGSSGTEFGAVINAIASVAYMSFLTSVIFRRSDDQIDIEDARRDTAVSDPVADAQLDAGIARRYSRYEDNPLFIDDRRTRAAQRHRERGGEDEPGISVE